MPIHMSSVLILEFLSGSPFLHGYLELQTMCSHLLQTDTLTACKRPSKPEEYSESTRAAFLLLCMHMFCRRHPAVERERQRKFMLPCPGWASDGWVEMGRTQW